MRFPQPLKSCLHWLIKPYRKQFAHVVTVNWYDSIKDSDHYLGWDHFDELIEKAKLSHFTVKSLSAVLHARLKNLRIIQRRLFCFCTDKPLLQQKPHSTNDDKLLQVLCFADPCTVTLNCSFDGRSLTVSACIASDSWGDWILWARSLVASWGLINKEYI